MSTQERYELIPEWSRGDRLRKARSLTGMTVAEFADHIGVSDRTIRSLGIEGSIHRCRHYYCTKLLRSGVHVRRVQKLMRHAHLETTAAYAAVDEDELRDAINLLPSFDQPA